jgi:hypothetical protein
MIRDCRSDSGEMQVVVDIKHNARHRGVLGQKQDAVSDFFWLACSVERRLFRVLVKSSAGLSVHRDVSMTPGETALTRSGANSRAKVMTRRSIAPLTALSPAVPGAAATRQV